MSVSNIGNVVDNKARVTLERAFRNYRKQVLGVNRESKWTFGFSPQAVGVSRVLIDFLETGATIALCGPFGPVIESMDAYWLSARPA